MSDSANEHTAELRIVFQGPTGSFTDLSTIAKKPWKPDCCCLVRIRDDPYLSWVGQGNSCKPRSRVSTFEAGGYTAKSENRSARWWCTVGGDVVSQKMRWWWEEAKNSGPNIQSRSRTIQGGMQRVTVLGHPSKKVRLWNLPPTNLDWLTSTFCLFLPSVQGILFGISLMELSAFWTNNRLLMWEC